MWIIVPICICSIVSAKAARYILPILPAMALIVSFGLTRFNRSMRCLFFLIMFIQYFSLSYDKYSVFNLCNWRIKFPHHMLGTCKISTELRGLLYPSILKDKNGQADQ